MKRGSLSEHFKGIGIKRLSAVEANPNVSHQHEYNGVRGFKNLFGTERIQLHAKFIYLSDNEENVREDETVLTWYDARENHPTRTEYRLYYPDTKVSLQARENDLLIIAKKNDNEVIVINAEAHSTTENQLLWLFGYSNNEIDTHFNVKEFHETDSLGFISSIILERVGIVLEETNDEKLEHLLQAFPNGFPKTMVFSEFARRQCEEIDLSQNPDEGLVRWLDEEESLFRIYENHIVGEKIEKGFQNVDDFIEFSLSVQNRRKSRAGHSLENHLRYLFEHLNIHHSFNKVTENNSRPDFIFPSIEKYHDTAINATSLTMLGVKTSCKDRWRQVLAEANRIEHKHLFTLEPGISVNQTNEMNDNQLQLVTPRTIHSTYTADQQAWLLSLKDFNEVVTERQIVLN